MLEKLGIKNLAACENQGKQHNLRVVRKSREEMMQKRQKVLHKKKKVMQLVKPISY